ncbi:hypothetical protein D307_gp222 [Bacillus phage Bastille]|uniref:Uncharacterized protein n=4 Tax=Bastillevirus TaxID=1918010 RepID=A0A024B0Y4_9CAUD|nr:hypothetical protein D307_gp222 [Bacillus phage Bastille]YP_009035633.1 hypothetical protein FP76_gp258 [Bacillus phage Evoli]AMW61865.1 hypothetical protein DNAM5_121 [Bacillus phage Vinny]ASU00961.1 hypothetical protein ANTHONY_121 [Bacillus phage Anthony]AEQ34242.1 hypothetical protein [Bacillus phage Bastille]AHZ09836.1 hypothetical protein [Bacillus phage Evoli]
MIRLSETDTVENVGIIREAGTVYDFRNHLNLFFEVDEQFEESGLLSVAVNVQGAKDLIEELQAFVNQMEEEEHEKDTYGRDVYVSTVDGLCD